MDFNGLISFLQKLGKNNNKEWFDANKKNYDALRKDWIDFVNELIGGIQRFDKDLGHVEPKQCIFRINRDIRFSSDKSPYKTNFGASINRGGKNSPFAGYYIHIQPGECFLAGGMYMPESHVLNAVRQEIDYHLADFKKIISHKDFKNYFGNLSGDKLSRPPKGYDESNPAIDFLKHKSFLMYHKLDEAKLTSKNFNSYCQDVFKAMRPTITFLNSAIEN